MEEDADKSSKSLMKEAWIKLADDKGVIHALRTLANEEVRSSVVTDQEWEDFKALLGVPETPIESLSKSGAQESFTCSLWVHVGVWLLFSSLLVATWARWFGQRRGWWGEFNCPKCNIPVEQVNRRCCYRQPQKPSKPMVDVERQPFLSESADIADDCGPTIDSAQCLIACPTEPEDSQNSLNRQTVSQESHRSNDAFDRNSSFKSSRPSQDSISPQSIENASLNSHSVEKCASTCKRSRKCSSSHLEAKNNVLLNLKTKPPLNMLFAFMESNSVEEEEPLEFKGEFKKFFKLTQSTGSDDIEQMVELEDKDMDYKMWFVVGLVFCLALTALLCAFQIIHLEEKYLRLYKHTAKCQTALRARMDTCGHEQHHHVTAAFVQEAQVSGEDSLTMAPMPARVTDVNEKSANLVRSKHHKHSKKHSETTVIKSHSESKRKKHISGRGERSASTSNISRNRGGSKILKKIAGTTEMLKPWRMKD